MQKQITKITYGDTELNFRSAIFYLGRHKGSPRYILSISDARNKPKVFNNDEVTVTTSAGETILLRISKSDLDTKDNVKYIVVGDPTFL